MLGQAHHLPGCSWKSPQGGPLELWLGRLGALGEARHRLLRPRTEPQDPWAPPRLILGETEAMEGRPWVPSYLPWGRALCLLERGHRWVQGQGYQRHLTRCSFVRRPDSLQWSPRDTACGKRWTRRLGMLRAPGPSPETHPSREQAWL